MSKDKTETETAAPSEPVHKKPASRITDENRYWYNANQFNGGPVNKVFVPTQTGHEPFSVVHTVDSDLPAETGMPRVG